MHHLSNLNQSTLKIDVNKVNHQRGKRTNKIHYPKTKTGSHFYRKVNYIPLVQLIYSSRTIIEIITEMELPLLEE